LAGPPHVARPTPIQPVSHTAAELAAVAGAQRAVAVGTLLCLVAGFRSRWPTASSAGRGGFVGVSSGVSPGRMCSRGQVAAAVWARIRAARVGRPNPAIKPLTCGDGRRPGVAGVDRQDLGRHAVPRALDVARRASHADARSGRQGKGGGLDSSVRL